MSKGKQWWPHTASIQDAKNAITSFQERLRQKRWLRTQEGSVCHYVYAKEGAYPALLGTVNEYMQMGSSDTGAKNRARVNVLRLLCTLLRFHIQVRPKAHIKEPPAVFAAPGLHGHDFLYGIIAEMEQEGKTITLIVSEMDLAGAGSDVVRARSWAVPQTGDSYKWMTTKIWQDQRQKTSFGKWVFAGHHEKRSWIETLPPASQWQEKNIGLLRFDGQDETVRNMLKHLGASYKHSEQVWLLPEAWGEEAVKEWIKDNMTNPLFQPKPKPVYNRAEKTQAHTRPDPTQFAHAENVHVDDDHDDDDDDDDNDGSQTRNTN